MGGRDQAPPPQPYRDETPSEPPLAQGHQLVGQLCYSLLGLKFPSFQLGEGPQSLTTVETGVARGHRAGESSWGRPEATSPTRVACKERRWGLVPRSVCTDTFTLGPGPPGNPLCAPRDPLTCPQVLWDLGPPPGLICLLFFPGINHSPEDRRTLRPGVLPENPVPGVLLGAPRQHLRDPLDTTQEGAGLGNQRSGSR